MYIYIPFGLVHLVLGFFDISLELLVLEVRLQCLLRQLPSTLGLYV
jgi:hypothetical protein